MNGSPALKGVLRERLSISTWIADMSLNVDVSRSRSDPMGLPFEIIERKGAGHPDTLADALAEHLSCTYSQYTIARFGAILRHQFDKTALMCGRARVAFGQGELIEPIRVLLNGRASARLGSEEIPVEDLLTEATREFFRARFPMLDARRDLRILFEVRHGPNTTTGGIFGDEKANEARIHYRFHPRSLADLPESHRVEANDTSLGCAWAPYTDLEAFVLGIERELNSLRAKGVWPWLGSDIKIMGTRQERRVGIVIAAPVLSTATGSAPEYFDRVEMISRHVRGRAAEQMPKYELSELVINSGDDLASRKLYMNYTGSSIESGDEGLVGRGNRIGGLISPLRPYTMEGIAGKNPRYHVGKVYCAAAYDIARILHENFAVASDVYLINRMAEPLSMPWRAIVDVGHQADVSVQEISNTVDTVVRDLETVTNNILDGRYPLF